MTINEAIKEYLHKRKWSQADLAMEAGFKGQSAVGMVLKIRNSVQVDTLLKMLNAMGCELIIRDKFDRTNEITISMESEDNA